MPAYINVTSYFFEFFVVWVAELLTEISYRYKRRGSMFAKFVVGFIQ